MNKSQAPFFSQNVEEVKNEDNQSEPTKTMVYFAKMKHTGKPSETPRVDDDLKRIKQSKEKKTEKK